VDEHPGYVAPAGWYVDPGDDVQLRWWSGLDWTEHCAPMVEHRPEPDARPATDTDRQRPPGRDIGDADAQPGSPDVSPDPAARPGIPDASSVADAQPGTSDTPPGTPDAAQAPDRPLTRRERRLLDEQADATRALPPPVPRIAPITSYGWDRESEPAQDSFEHTVSLQPAGRDHPADRYVDIPSRWSSASVWVIAFMPWISVVAGYAALVVALTAPRAWWWQLGALLLPYLLTLAAAQRDVLRLRIWRHRTVAHWAWSLLGAPVYLIARTVVLRRHAGLGSAPLWVWLVNLLLVTGAVVVVLALVGLSYRGY